MTRYLLGQMSAGDRSRFEEQYLADPELFEELIAAEDEMVRSYLRGDCAGPDKKDFESRYLTTQPGRDKVEFEQSLMEYLASSRVSAIQDPEANRNPATDAGVVRGARHELADKQPVEISRRPVVWVWGFAAACFVVALFAAWLTVLNVRLRHELAQLQTQQADLRSQADDLNRQLANLNAILQQKGEHNDGEIAGLQPPDAGMAPFVLTSHLERNPGPQRQLVIPRGVANAPVQLQLDHDDFSKFSVVLETADGEQIWKKDKLSSRSVRSGKRVIDFKLPASVVRSGSYVLRLSGTGAQSSEEVADYIFRAIKR